MTRARRWQYRIVTSIREEIAWAWLVAAIHVGGATRLACAELCSPCRAEGRAALVQHSLNRAQEPTGPVASKVLGLEEQSNDPVRLVDGSLACHGLRAFGLSDSPEVLDEHAVATQLKVRVPDPRVATLVDNRERVLVEIGNAVAVEHAADLGLAPATERFG